MNYSIVSPKIVCNHCSHVQWADAKHCSACGISFVWGKPNAWEPTIFSTSTTSAHIEAIPRGESPLAQVVADLIEVDEATDLEIDKCFANLRKGAKTRKYKLVPIKEDDNE